jgi:hypothetical protein
MFLDKPSDLLDLLFAADQCGAFHREVVAGRLEGAQYRERSVAQLEQALRC